MGMAPPSAPRASAVSDFESNGQLAFTSWSRRVGKTGAEKGLEALAGFVLGSEITGAPNSFGAGLCGEQTLQLQRLLHAKSGKFVSGLRDFKRTTCVAGAGHGVVKQPGVGADTVGDLPLHQGRALEAGIVLVPSGFGVAQNVIGRERRRQLLGEQLGVTRFCFAELQGEACPS